MGQSFISGGNASNGQCSNFYDGFVPSATLGLSPVDSQGYAVDAWNNRIHYAITSSNGDAFTTTNGMRRPGLSARNPDLLCAQVPPPAALTAQAAEPIMHYFQPRRNGSNLLYRQKGANSVGPMKQPTSPAIELLLATAKYKMVSMTWWSGFRPTFCSTAWSQPAKGAVGFTSSAPPGSALWRISEHDTPAQIIPCGLRSLRRNSGLLAALRAAIRLSIDVGVTVTVAA